MVLLAPWFCCGKNFILTVVFSHDAGQCLIAGVEDYFAIGIHTLISIVPTLISIIFNFLW